MFTRVISTIAQFAFAHQRIALLILLVMVAALIGLITAGLVSLVMAPSWPKTLCFAAATLAAWLATTRRLS